MLQCFQEFWELLRTVYFLDLLLLSNMLKLENTESMLNYALKMHELYVKEWIIMDLDQ